MSVGTICNRLAPTASMDTSVVAAARCLIALGEPILVVVGEGGATGLARGIVTEHEIAGVIARGTDLSRVVLKDIMRTDPAFVTDTADVFETACWMHRNRLREAVVHDESGKLAGVVTLDQLIESLAGEIDLPEGRTVEQQGAVRRHALH